MKMLQYVFFTLFISVNLFGTKMLEKVLPKNKRKPFVTFVKAGQLGNQLFQTAAGISLAYDNGACFVYCFQDPPSPDQYDKLPHYYPEIFAKFYCKRRSSCRYTYPGYRVPLERTYNFYPIPYKRNMRINGYYQSYKYFDHNKELILESFAPTEKRLKHLQDKYKEILDEPITVALHIRSYHGDFSKVNNQERIYQLFPYPNIGFMEKAINHFPENALFVVCTDDIRWSKKALKHINRRFFFPEDSMMNDFYLMSLCDHNIVGNSTYSWWSAYLNKNREKIVIAPNQFANDPQRKLEDTYPDDWIIIDRVEDGRTPIFYQDSPFANSQ